MLDMGASIFENKNIEFIQAWGGTYEKKTQPF
jgi:hypothetical protein